MPSYLYPEQNIPIQPYNSPLELYSKALQLKDARFKEGLSNLRNKYDSILNADLTNKTNSEKVRAGVENVMKTLSKTIVNDISLPENQAQIDGLFDPIIKDKDVIYDMAWTSNHRSELSKAESLSKTKPELVKPQNLEILYRAQEAYRSSDPGNRPEPTKFSPYYDFNTIYNGELDKIKKDVSLSVVKGKGLTIKGPDGTIYDLDDNNVTQQQITGIRAWKVEQMLWQRINQDPAALNQMRIDHEYNKNNGFYSPESAIADIDSYTEFFTRRNKVYTDRLNSGYVDDNDKETFETDIKTGRQRIQELNDIKTAIKTDPSKASEYFTFNKFVKDYVESKAKQYSHREDGLLMDVPGYKGALEGRINMLEKDYEDRRSALKASREASDKETIAMDLTQTPYADLYTELSDGKPIKKPKEFIQGLLGLSKDKDNNLVYSMSYAATNQPGSMVILQPATNNLTSEQTETVYIGSILSVMKSDLDNLNITRLVDDLELTKDGDLTGRTKKVSVKSSSENLLNDYNLLSKEEKQKVDGVLEKYKPLLAEFNIDPFKKDQIRAAETKLADKSIDEAVKAGIELNSSLGGQFTFIPDDDINVQQGGSGKIYTTGMIKVKVSELDKAKVPYKQLIRNDLAKYGPVEKSVDNSKGKAVEVADQTIYIHASIPVNGDIFDINDQLLQSTGLATGAEGPNYRTRSKRKLEEFKTNVLGKVGTFYKDLQTLPPTLEQPTSDPMGRPYTYPTRETSETFKEIRDLTKDYAAQSRMSEEAAYKEIVSVVKLNQNPVKALSNFRQLKAKVMGNSIVGKFKRAIAGNEADEKGYFSGAKPGEKYNKLGTTAAGMYGLLEGTFYNVQKMKGFPEEFKNKSFEDYKVSPEIQEAAATVLITDLYKKYEDPVLMAVAWLTGENSVEFKAFQKDKEAAYQTFKNRKPSDSVGPNMTLGAYIDRFLTNFK